MFIDLQRGMMVLFIAGYTYRSSGLFHIFLKPSSLKPDKDINSMVHHIQGKASNKRSQEILSNAYNWHNIEWLVNFQGYLKLRIRVFGWNSCFVLNSSNISFCTFVLIPVQELDDSGTKRITHLCSKCLH